MKYSLYNTNITATASGASSSILLTPGRWNLFITSNSWNSGQQVHLEISPDNVKWTDAIVNDEIVSFTSDGTKESNGNLYTRLYIDSYNADVNLIAKKFE